MAIPERGLHNHDRNPCKRVTEPVTGIQQPGAGYCNPVNLYGYFTDIGIKLLPVPA
ncbi:hypothetical protein D3C71_2202490 [compost metagenome]